MQLRRLSRLGRLLLHRGLRAAALYERGSALEEREVLDAARAIRPHLPDLVGEGADEVDDQLQLLLVRSETGETVKIAILQVLGQRDATRQWAYELLKVPQRDRSYEALPGKVQVVSVPKYVCPKGDGTPWYRFSISDQVPLCPNHRILLVEVPRPGASSC